MKNNKQTTTQTTTSEPWKVAQPYLTDVMQAAQGAAQRPLEQIAQCSQALGAFAADAAPPAAGMHASA